MKHPLLLASSLLLLLASCKRDDITETSCRITKVMLFDNNGAPDDEARLSYSGNQVTEVRYSDGRYTIAYDGEGRVLRRTFFSLNASTPFRYDTLIYGADRSLALLERFTSAPGGFIRSDSVRLEYNNGQLLERRQYSIPPLSFSGPLELRNIYRYTYTGNNITRLVREQYSGGAPSYTLTTVFSADRLPNYFNGQGPHFYLVDPTGATGLLENIHSVMMANNIVQTSTDTQPPTAYEVTYLSNSQGLLSEVRLNGTPTAAYAYECQ